MLLALFRTRSPADGDPVLLAIIDEFGAAPRMQLTDHVLAGAEAWHPTLSISGLVRRGFEPSFTGPPHRSRRSRTVSHVLFYCQIRKRLCLLVHVSTGHSRCYLL